MRRCFGPVVVALLILGHAGCSATKKNASESTIQKSPDEIAAMIAGPPFPYPLDHWSDSVEAREKGESTLYQNALSREAATLDALSMQELCASVLRLMNAFQEEAEWEYRIARVVFSDAEHKPLDAALAKSFLRLRSLMDTTVGKLQSDLQYGLKPGASSFWRKDLQETIIRSENELPVIQRERRALVEMLAREIPKMPSNAASGFIESAKITKTLAMRGAAASSNDSASPPRDRPVDVTPIFPVAVPQDAHGLWLGYNQFPFAKDETTCHADINFMPAKRDSTPTTGTGANLWVVNGVISVTMDDATIDVPLSGSLELLKDENPSVSRWCIQSGALEITAVGATVARLVLLSYGDYVITLDESGEGKFIAAFNDELATGPRSMFSRYLLKLPIALSGDSFVIHLPTTRVEDLATPKPRVTSDYNKDGILEYGSDFAAFLRDFDLHTPLADMNNDGAWDARDIDLWAATFWEDHTICWQRPD